MNNNGLESLWLDEWRRIDFKFRDRDAILVFPKKENASTHWLLKTEYFGAFPNLEVEMLRRGYHLAYLANINRWGLDADMDAKADFADFLQQEYGLSARCVPVGMSCGGLHAIKFAAKYPQKVSVLYLDAPVVNLLSCPMYMGTPRENAGSASMEGEALLALGLTRSEMIAYREHPFDKIPTLVANRIPVVLVYGDADKIVYYHENGALLEKAYEKTDIDHAVFGKEDCDHHPHGLEDPTPIAAFIQNHDGA